MAEIVWSPQTLLHLRDIRAFIARDSPAAAARLGLRIVALTQALEAHPFLGRALGAGNLRELIVAGTPYVIVYRVFDRSITVLTIRHARQQE